jgi:hypothetical protein
MVLSGETYITLEWDQVLDTELPVLSYSILVNDGFGGSQFHYVVENLKPNVRSFLVSELRTGNQYDFLLEAYNYNGASQQSDPASFIVCTLPYQLSNATMTQVTRTTMQLTW